MTNIPYQFVRILAIAPSSRGFGFAVLEGPSKLIDWGVKSIRREKNKDSNSRAEEMILYYRPEVLVLEDSESKASRRSGRIRMLTKELVALGRNYGIKVRLFSQARVRATFFGQTQGNKHALATIIAARFPQELVSRLPPKRRPWMSEDYRMDIFDAVALALMIYPENVASARIDDISFTS